MCIAFVLGLHISMDASFLEPAAIADTRVDAVLTSTSARAASSAYCHLVGWVADGHSCFSSVMCFESLHESSDEGDR